MPIDAKLVRDHFLAAAELPATERAAYLAQYCAADAELLAAVERLLAAHKQPASVLNEAATSRLAATLPPTAREQSGTIIASRYKLLEAIGEGGMGTVWVAEQSEPVRRRVALKLIKAGMDTQEVLSRFEAERQALALMDHPNIAKVFDGGMTEHGRPFFVMEYVKGLPITQYCDESRLTIVERLALFAQVCHAVQHAHQKGIIHRDLKPTNILVCLYDGVPVPKVIDFGLAKAMHQSLTERTLYTAHGMLVGTPLYMSPEQAEFNNLDIDTRSDIYSLGVILYELLTGSTPLERRRFQQAAWQEMLRLIKEEEPPRPSARLSSTETLASVAASRQSEPARLTKLVRGELDWIVLKALEKDRRRRYETATGFAADVQRYLADEPVQACPPSTAYRFGKFARRNKLALATAAMFSAALLAAVIVLAISNVWVRRERDQKDQALREKTAALTEAMESAKQARRAVDEMLTEVGGSTLANVPQMTEVRRALLEKALDFHREFLERWGNTPELRQEAGRAYRRVGDINRIMAQREDAEQAYQQALTLQEALVQEFPHDVEHIRELAATYHSRGQLRRIWANPEEWEQSHRRAIALREELVDRDPRNPEDRVALASSCDELARVFQYHYHPQRLLEAEQFYRRALEIAQQVVDDFPAESKYRRVLCGRHNELGNLFNTAGKLEQALEQYRISQSIAEKLAADQATAADQQLLVMGYWNVGSTSMRLGQWQSGEELFRKALGMYERRAAEFPGELNHSRQVCEGWYELGDLLKEANRIEDAERAYRRALGVAEHIYLDFPQAENMVFRVIDTLLKFTTLLREQGRSDEAAKLIADTFARLWSAPSQAQTLDAAATGNTSWPMRQARLIQWCFEHYIVLTGLPQPRSPDVNDAGGPYLKIGLLLEAGGNYPQAVQAYRRCIEIAPSNVSGYDRLARLLAYCPQVEFRDASRAVELSRRATELLPKEGSFWSTRGLAHYRAGQWQLAIDALHEAAEWREEENGLDWLVLAMAQHRLGKHGEAKSWFDKASAWMEKHGAMNEEAQRLHAEAEEFLKVKVPSQVKRTNHG